VQGQSDPPQVISPSVLGQLVWAETKKGKNIKNINKIINVFFFIVLIFALIVL